MTDVIVKEGNVTEDDMTTALINYKSLEENQEDLEESINRVEEYYDSYKFAGIADLYYRGTWSIGDGVFHTDEIYEMKYRLDNANEVIRQVKKMKEYFYEGSDWDRPEDGKATFVLAIYPSKENLSHLNRYLEMYKSLYDEGVEIGLLHHQCMEPVSIFPNSNVSPRRMEDYLEYLEGGEGMKKRLAQFIRSEME